MFVTSQDPDISFNHCILVSSMWDSGGLGFGVEGSGFVVYRGCEVEGACIFSSLVLTNCNITCSLSTTY